MEPLRRDQVVDYQTWTDQRPAELARILAIKQPRRVHVGPHLTFLFENTDTVRWQVQEMMRVERIVREKEVQHEIDTYNELLAGPGGLGCTLLIEIDDPATRDVKLRAWLGLPQRLWIEVSDEVGGVARVPPTIDGRQVGEDRLSSVQYLKFDLGGRAPVAIGCDHPEYTARSELTPEQRAALTSDLA